MSAAAVSTTCEMCLSGKPNRCAGYARCARWETRPAPVPAVKKKPGRPKGVPQPSRLPQERQAAIVADLKAGLPIVEVRARNGNVSVKAVRRLRLLYVPDYKRGARAAG